MLQEGGSAQVCKHVSWHKHSYGSSQKGCTGFRTDVYKRQLFEQLDEESKQEEIMNIKNGFNYAKKVISTGADMVVAVSYTHLDVYKRQATDCVIVV